MLSKSIKKLHKGRSSIGTIAVLTVAISLAISLGSGSLNVSPIYTPTNNQSPYNPNAIHVTAAPTGKQIVLTEAPRVGNNMVQMGTFDVITLTPVPLAPIHGCQSSQFNDEPEILVGSDPGPGGVVGANGKIRVWAADEGAPYIAPHEDVDLSTGAIKKPGDRTASDGRGNGYYLWEPAIYITPLTSGNQKGTFAGDAESGGAPYFPSTIKGEFNNLPGGRSNRGGGKKGAPIDADYIKFENGPNYINRPAVPINQIEQYAAEFIWDVASFNLTAGSYRAEFVVHDGDVNIGIDCITIQI